MQPFQYHSHLLELMDRFILPAPKNLASPPLSKSIAQGRNHGAFNFRPTFIVNVALFVTCCVGSITFLLETEKEKLLISIRGVTSNISVKRRLNM